MSRTVVPVLDKPDEVKILVVEPGVAREVVFSDFQIPTVYHLNVGVGATLRCTVTNLPSRLQVIAEVAPGGTLYLVIVAPVRAAAVCTATVLLQGDGARAMVQHALVSRGTGELVLETTMEHAARNTYGRIISRRVQYDASVSVHHAMLRVAPAGHGTDTYLSDKALLLSPQARATSVPGLEILADDVQASHGATIGKLSRDALFYLQSRGILPSEAIRLLATAWLEPALAGVPPDLRSSLFS